MKAKEMIARARWYEQFEDASPSECLLSVLIDIFTDEIDDEEVEARTVEQTWERLTRDLAVPEWLEQCQTLNDGVDVLAGNLAEAGRRDLAAMLRSISQPRFGGASRSPDLESGLLRRLDDAPARQGERRLWGAQGTPLPRSLP
jgi:hypothetical protein